MHYRSFFASQRIARLLAFVTLSCALAAPAANAANTAPTKKPSSSASASKAKKTPDKQAAAKKSTTAQKKAAAQKKAVAQKKTTSTKKAQAARLSKANANKKVARKNATATRAVKAAAAGAAAVAVARPSFGQLAGLHKVSDPLELKSSVALVLDQDTKEVLFSKNDHAVLPIASITKLMTGLLIAEAGLPMDEVLTITRTTWIPKRTAAHVCA